VALSIGNAMSKSYNTPANKSTSKNENLSFLKEIYVEPPNFTQFPNILTDHVMRITSGGEWKILSAICRKTFGWHTNWMDISLSYLANTTGLTKTNAIIAIDGLIEKGLVEKKKTGKTGCEKSWYKLVMKSDQNKQKSPPQYLKKSDFSEVKKPSNNFDQSCSRTSPVAGPNKERYTLSKESYIKKEVVKKKEPDKPHAPSAATDFSQKKEIRTRKQQILLTDTEIHGLIDRFGEKLVSSKIRNLEKLMAENPRAYTTKSPYEDVYRWCLEEMNKKSKLFTKKEEVRTGEVMEKQDQQVDREEQRQNEFCSYIQKVIDENPKVSNLIKFSPHAFRVDFYHKNNKNPHSGTYATDGQYKQKTLRWLKEIAEE
jgi:phage replication O-like protein O